MVSHPPSLRLRGIGVAKSWRKGNNKASKLVQNVGSMRPYGVSSCGEAVQDKGNARNDIAGMRPGKVSVMPQGLNEQLAPQELADLLAFLKATRW